MGFYKDHIVPHLINFSMKNREVAAYRGRVVPAARGRVLEIGVGSGLNFPFYSSDVEHITALDPSPKLLAMTRKSVRNSAVPVELIEGSAEAIPLEDRIVDTVVTTWTLCSIPDTGRALGEMRRVLKPGGELLFAEHGWSPDPKVQAWQNRLTPLWKRVGGGCHLNRPIERLIAGGGFRITELKTGYMKGPRPMTFIYEGRATPA